MKNDDDATPSSPASPLEERPADNAFDVFFQEALTDLRQYSESSGLAEWSCPQPETLDFNGVFHMRFFIPKVVPGSVRIAFDGDNVIVSGVRWAAPPGERWESEVTFQRIAAVPDSVVRDCDPVFSIEDDSLLLLMPKKGTAARPLRTRKLARPGHAMAAR